MPKGFAESFGDSFFKQYWLSNEAARRDKSEKRAQEEHDERMAEAARVKKIREGIGAAWDSPVSQAPQLRGPAFDTPEEAAAAVGVGPMAKPGIPTDKGMTAAPPADPLAPLPEQQAAIPRPQQQAAPQLVQVRDTMTGKWHNEDPTSVRPPADTDRARAVAQYLMGEGENERAMQFLSNFAQQKVSMRNMDKQAASDELARNFTNPTKFAESLNNLVGPFETGAEITAVNVPDGNGGTYPALQINQRGSATPPMYLDEAGQPTPNPPPPGAYRYTAAALQRIVAGDQIGDVIAQMLQFQATIQNMSIAGAREGREAGMYPLQRRQAIANIANTEASTTSTRVNTGIAINQDARAQGEHDYNYGNGDLTIERQNNPAALEYRPWMERFGAKKNGRFAQFDKPEDAVRAQEHLLTHGYIKRGINTVGEVVNTYLGMGQENSAASRANYKAYVADRLGIDVNAPLNEADVPKLGAAMREFETGRRPGGRGLSPKDTRAVQAKASERLASLKDKATTMAARQYEPDDPAFEGAVKVAMVQLLKNEPKEVQNAFRSQFGVGSTLLSR